MSIFNSIFSAIFDGFFAAAGLLGGEAALWIFSAVAGILLLFIFKLTSNQAAIRRSKDRIAAGFLEVRLFKDDMRQMMSAQGSIFGSAFRYMGHALVPMLWMVVPVLLMLIQLNVWYGYRPLKEGEKALVTARLQTEESLFDLGELSLRTESDGLKIDTPPLRIDSKKEINWRVKAVEGGNHTLVFKAGDTEVIHTVHVGGSFLKIEPARVRGAWEELWHPGSEPLPADQPFYHVEITYPESETNLLGLRMHWVIVFFILTLVFGFALKGLFKVEI